MLLLHLWLVHAWPTYPLPDHSQIYAAGTDARMPALGFGTHSLPDGESTYQAVLRADCNKMRHILSTETFAGTGRPRRFFFGGAPPSHRTQKKHTN